MYDDADLVRQALRGDREAFGMLVAQYEKPIYNLAYRMVGDADEAADIAQNAFVKAYRKLASYDPAHRFFSWLYRIAVNEALNHLAWRRRSRELNPDPPAAVPQPDDDFQLVETSDLLGRALAAMSLEQRVVIILKHLILLPYREIAAILEIPEKTVKSRLFAARHVLREQVIKQGYTR
jgi:RNA polymerase sigma-70 factor, ECF subfamily